MYNTMENLQDEGFLIQIAFFCGIPPNVDVSIKREPESSFFDCRELPVANAADHEPRQALQQLRSFLEGHPRWFVLCPRSQLFWTRL